jgi:hypothetical protein
MRKIKVTLLPTSDGGTHPEGFTIRQITNAKTIPGKRGAVGVNGWLTTDEAQSLVNDRNRYEVTVKAGIH